MISAVEKYLDTLLAFVPKKKGTRNTKDYISLIHVPAKGPEKVYSLVLDDEHPILTVASYKHAVWEVIEDVADPKYSPELNALQAQVPADHPAFIFLDRESVSRCKCFSDGRAGLDYYLMLWQIDGEANVVECYEPYARENQAWLTVVGVLQVLSSEFEYAAAQG